MFYDFLRPFLFRVDPERAHNMALSMLARPAFIKAIKAKVRTVEKPVDLWGLRFRNSLGVAAGFDKNALALPGWLAMGFGFIEIGTVTRHAQDGNPKPRIFRIPSKKALINRLGFPNEGADRIAERLASWRKTHEFTDFPIGVNIGKSKITELEEAESDYLYSFEKFYELGDFFVVNVSSPNTPGLRELQDPEQLRPILKSLKDAAQKRQDEAGRSKPLLVKIAPDLEENQIAELLAVLIDTGVDGIVATNTTIDHSSVQLQEKGGLSGKPLRERSTEVIRFITKETQGQLPIIGVGGVSSFEDYQAKMDAGASLVEMYTGVIYEGPSAAWKILSKS